MSKVEDTSAGRELSWMLIVRRCRHCPSPELSPVPFRAIDCLLLCVAVRRQRCEFCGHLQWTWLVPRPLRWGLALVLMGALYFASTGPVKWLHDNHRMSDTTYERIDRWVYWPINRWIESPQEQESSFSSALHSYREWWSPTFEPSPPRDVPQAGSAAIPETLPADRADAQESPGTLTDAIEHRVGRPTGEVPQQ